MVEVGEGIGLKGGRATTLVMTEHAARKVVKETMIVRKILGKPRRSGSELHVRFNAFIAHDDLGKLP
jgi:hypothetical protein